MPKNWLTFGQSLRPYLTRKHLLIAGGGLLSLLFVVYTIMYYWPRTVSFSYSGINCFTNPTLLPKTIDILPSATYTATQRPSLSLASYPLYSNTTCLTPIKPPVPGIETLTFVPRGTLLKKFVQVSPEPLPALIDKAVFTKPIATKDPLVLHVDRRDHVFEYRLTAHDRTVPCPAQNHMLVCNVARLELAQSTSYNFVLRRFFNNHPVSTVFTRQLTTVEAIHVTASSIVSNQMVYNAPGELTLTLDKPADTFKNVTLKRVAGESHQTIPITTTLKDKLVTVHFDKPLERNTLFVLSIENIMAPDGSFLVEPFSLPFKTSGGPKVVSVNIGKSKVQPSSSIVLRFDTEISTSQPVREFVRLEANGSAIATTISAQGHAITLKPQAALPRCAVLTVKVLDGLQNSFGISGGSVWQFKSRVLCQTVFSIGSSVQGRSIAGYSFGSGSSKIIFVGGTHGNERSSSFILSSWVDALENNPDRIPGHRTIIVIPDLNPDSSGISRRTNANNVDLNRNFPANNWKSGVTMPDKSYLEHGGGTAALSEPESRALANYTLNQHPRLVLTYHASGGVVVPNDSGDSYALAVDYAKQSSVGFLPNGQTGHFFEYDTTGAYEDWLHDKQGIPALLIELLTKTNSEFSGHQNAMWRIVQLP